MNPLLLSQKIECFFNILIDTHTCQCVISFPIQLMYVTYGIIIQLRLLAPIVGSTEVPKVSVYGVGLLYISQTGNQNKSMKVDFKVCIFFPGSLRVLKQA